MKKPKKILTKEEQQKKDEMKQEDVDFFLDTIDDPIKVALLKARFGPDRISMDTMGDGQLEREIMAIFVGGMKPKDLIALDIYKKAIINRVYSIYRKLKKEK